MMTFTPWTAEHPFAICSAAAEAAVGHLAAVEAAVGHLAAAEAAVGHLAAAEAEVEHRAAAGAAVEHPDGFVEASVVPEAGAVRRGFPAELQAPLRAAAEAYSGRAEAPLPGGAVTTREHPWLLLARAALVRDGAVRRVLDHLAGLSCEVPGGLFDFPG